MMTPSSLDILIQARIAGLRAELAILTTVAKEEPDDTDAPIRQDDRPRPLETPCGHDPGDSDRAGKQGAMAGGSETRAHVADDRDTAGREDEGLAQDTQGRPAVSPVQESQPFGLDMRGSAVEAGTINSNPEPGAGDDGREEAQPECSAEGMPEPIRDSAGLWNPAGEPADEHPCGAQEEMGNGAISPSSSRGVEGAQPINIPTTGESRRHQDGGVGDSSPVADIAPQGESKPLSRATSDPWRITAPKPVLKAAETAVEKPRPPSIKELNDRRKAIVAERKAERRAKRLARKVFKAPEGISVNA